jgi:hypothetical protein
LQPSDRIIKYCHKLIEDGLNKFALQKACEHALMGRKFEKAFDLFEALKESGAPLRQHYFWPFFACSKSEKGV